MKRLSDQRLADLETASLDAGEKRFRARQIREWTLKRGVFDPALMTNLPAPLREELGRRFPVAPLAVVNDSLARDGTRKLLFRLADGKLVESVLIPTAKRGTVCLSSQVGCAVGCHFCASGIGGGKRNLSSGEIVEQYLAMSRRADADGHPITNLVMMGMGEPMFNYDNVFEALATINAPEGPNLGARRITVSTIGIRNGVEKFIAAKTQYTLAFSLHAPNDRLRRKIVPLESAMRVAEIKDAATRYLATTGREVTFEYVLLKDVNDHRHDAHELTDLLRGVRGLVNLIPYNPVPELPYDAPDAARVDEFERVLTRAGVRVSVRRRRGADIDAACGQLALKAAANTTESEG